MCIRDRCTTVAHNIAQNRPDNFPSYPPDNRHCSDDVYMREGGDGNRKCMCTQSWDWATTRRVSSRQSQDKTCKRRRWADIETYDETSKDLVQRYILLNMCSVRLDCLFIRIRHGLVTIIFCVSRCWLDMWHCMTAYCVNTCVLAMSQSRTF